MNWIQEHWKDIAAIGFALYGAARTIVALTPTPKDDAALEKVAGPVRAIAKAFGLDLKQGVAKKAE